MSLNDLFGPFPGRPDHPDFARLSNIVLMLDGKKEDEDWDFAAWMNEHTVDIDSLMHMARQRVMIGAEATGVRMSDPMLVNVLASFYIDGFCTGMFYEREYPHEAPAS